MMEMKNMMLFQGLQSHMDTSKERIPDHEDRSVDITQYKTQRNKEMKEKVSNIQDLWYNFNDITHVIGVIEGKKEKFRVFPVLFQNFWKTPTHRTKRLSESQAKLQSKSHIHI